MAKGNGAPVLTRNVPDTRVRHTAGTSMSRWPTYLVHGSVAGAGLDGDPAQSGGSLLSDAGYGVMSRHTRMKVILSHAGGFLPYAAWRFTAGAQFNPATRPMGILTDLQRFYFDTALSSIPAAPPSLLAFAAPGHILYGSDHPFAPEESGLLLDSVLDSYDCFEPGQLDAINRVSAEALFPHLAGICPGREGPSGCNASPPGRSSCPGRPVTRRSGPCGRGDRWIPRRTGRAHSRGRGVDPACSGRWSARRASEWARGRTGWQPGARHDLNVDAERTPVLDHAGLEALVDNRLAASVSGPLTLGMLTWFVGAVPMVAAALWYDGEACRGLTPITVTTTRGRSDDHPTAARPSSTPCRRPRKRRCAAGHSLWPSSSMCASIFALVSCQSRFGRVPRIFAPSMLTRRPWVGPPWVPPPLPDAGPGATGGHGRGEPRLVQEDGDPRGVAASPDRRRPT